MINIGFYSSKQVDNIRLREMLREYAFLQTKRIKTYTIEYADQVLEKDILICFVDFIHYTKYKERMLNNKTIYFVILLDDPGSVSYNPQFNYFTAPFETPALKLILDDILNELENSTIMITIPHEGEKQLFIKDLNYIDIVHRSLCFHEINQNTTGFIVRQSFEKEVQKYLKHEELFLLKPSLVVNVSNIKILAEDHAVFRNGAILYYPKTKYKELREYWHNYFSND